MIATFLLASNLVMADSLVINEFMPNPEGADSGHEWVELYNPGTEAVSLAGWRLEVGKSSIRTAVVFDESFTIGPLDFFLVGEASVPGADVVALLSMGSAGLNSDMVRLTNFEGAVVDTVVYGSPNVDEWVDDSGSVATSLGPAAPSGQTIARRIDGVDTDACADDFTPSETPTPGASNVVMEPSDSITPEDSGGLEPSMEDDTGAAPPACSGSSDIKINEVLANPDGADGGNEWIELYNVGMAEVSLADWKIQGGTRPSSLSEDYVFDADTVLASGEFLVIGESGVASADVWADALSLGNAGENADIVQLVNCDGDVADTLVYGSPNDDEWVDDSGALATSLGPVAPSGHTIARLIDGADTDASAEDFRPSATPTPGAPNAFSSAGGEDGDGDGDADTGGASGGESDCPGAFSIKLNEILHDPEGSDGGKEWIELYNAGSATVNLDGWSVEGGSSSASTYLTFEGGVSLAAGEHLLIGDTEVPGADVEASLSLGNAGSNSDIVRLVDCSDVVVDTLVYGSPNEDEWVDDSGSVATSLAPKAATGMTLARRSDGYDTDACADDWVVSTEPTPGSENPSLDPIECVTGFNQIKINEFMVDPDSSLFGADVTDADLEWVELYNGSSGTVSVEGWQLQWGKSGTFSGSVVFESGAEIGPGDWMLIGGSLVSGADVTTSFDMGNANSNADALRLIDCEDVVQDTVVYGPNNDDGWLDDEAEVASSLAESPGRAKSAARVTDGVDTDQSGVDFVVTDFPTPGTTNAASSDTDCEPGEKDIKINEILPDPEGPDDGFEFIELYNTSSEELSIEGWVIATGTSSWPSEAGFSFPAGARIAAGGFVLVAGSEVPGADFYIDDDNEFSLGNGSSAPDGVRLEDCTGEVQDTVLYGDPADPIEDVELEDDRGLSTMATIPGGGLTMGRYPNGQDSDDNAVDFVSNTTPTPGAPNARSAEDGAESDGSEGDADGDIFDPGSWGDDTGREWDVEDTKPGCGGCSSAGQGPPVWWTWLPLMVCVGRRRQSMRLS